MLASAEIYGALVFPITCERVRFSRMNTTTFQVAGAGAPIHGLAALTPLTDVAEADTTVGATVLVAVLLTTFVAVAAGIDV